MKLGKSSPTAIERIGQVLHRAWQLSCLITAFVLCARGHAAQSDFRFRIVADTSATIPETSSPFQRLGAPAIDGGKVAFLGWNDSSGVGGLYVNQAAVLTALLDHTSDLPGPYTLHNALLGDHSSPAFHNGNASVLVETIWSGSDRRREILSIIGEQIYSVARSQGTSTIDSPSFFGNRTAYRARNPSPFPTSQVVWSPSGSIGAARTGDAAPGGLGNFSAISTVSALDDQVVSFIASTKLGTASSIEHVFALRDGVLTPIVSDGAVLPALSSPVTYFSAPIVDNGSVVVDISLESGDIITVKHDGTSLSLVSSPDEAIVDRPGETIGSLALRLYDYDDGQRLFASSGSIYADLGSGLTRVLSEGNALNGKVITHIEIVPGSSLSQGQVAMSLGFGDGTEAVVVATPVPEPNGLVLASLAAIVIAICRRRSMGMSRDQ